MITAFLQTREIVHSIQVTLPQKCSFFVFHFYFIQHKTRFHILIISLYRLSNHKSSPEQYSPIFLADNSFLHDFLSFSFFLGQHPGTTALYIRLGCHFHNTGLHKQLHSYRKNLVYSVTHVCTNNVLTRSSKFRSVL